MTASIALPIWTPHQVSESHGVEHVLRQMAADAFLDPETITDLQHAFGVGSTIWENQYLVIDRGGAPKPTHPDGALHYVAGWIATAPYLDVLQRWAHEDPFFRNLYHLGNAIKELEPFRYSSGGPIKMVSSRLIDGVSYVKRGHLPFPELLFRTWKSNNPGGVPQIALWAAYMNYCAYQETHRRSVFDEPVVDLLSQIRNAIAPEKNGGNKWISLKETLLHMPLVRTPNDVKTFLLRRAQEKPSDECWVEISRNIRKLGVVYKPLVYLGSKNALSRSDRLDVLKRFNLDDDELTGKPASSPVRSSSKESTSKSKPKLPDHASIKNEALQSDQGETYEENYLAQISGKIGSINLEFSQRAVYAENPFLSYKESIDVYRFLADINLQSRLQSPPQQDQANEYEACDLEGLAILIWTAIQIGGNLIASASLQINYTPQKGFGLQPDLSGIWRLRAQQQRTTPEVNQEIFLAPIAIEKRNFPDQLAANLKGLWKADFTHLGRISKINNKSVAKVMKEIGIQLSQSKLDWTSNLLRTFIAKTTDNETHALLLQSNAETNFTSDAAYYSVVNKTSGELLNTAGSPYFFRLEVFGTYLNKFLTQSYPANSLEAWNLWTDKVLAVLSCATGARPVVDLFAEVENFSDDFSLLIIDDKEVVTRDSKRIVRLPLAIASLLRRDYLQSLKELKNTFPVSHPIREGIDDLIQHKSGARIPLFFHLSPKGIDHVHFADIAAKIHFGLPSNFARHLISNHLSVEDRELISLQLGHQMEGLYTFGPNSLRTLQNDLTALANAFERLFAELKIVVPRSPDISSGVTETSTYIPKTFGKKKRNAAMISRWRKLARNIQKIARERISTESEKTEIDKPWELLQAVVSETTNDIASNSERTLIKRICTKQFRLLLPEKAGFFGAPSKNRPLEAMFDPSFLVRLNQRAATHPALMKLLKEINPRSRSDGITLLALSLVKHNGITDPDLFQKIACRRFQVFEFENRSYIEVFPGLEAKAKETCRRHQLFTNSIRFIDTLENYSNHPLKARNLRLSSNLLDDLAEIFGDNSRNKSPEELVQFAQEIEYTHQRFTLPAALAELARGNTAHRSVDRASWLAINGKHRPEPNAKDAITLNSIPASYSGKEITTQIKALIKSIDNPHADIDALCGGIEQRTIVHRALKTFTERLIQRRGQGRPHLANSTKKLYLGRLAEFFRRTDAQSAIEGLDREGLQETIDAYLDERSAHIDTVNDDARQIQDFCNSLLANGFPGPISVPLIDPDFNPSTTLLSDDELRQIDKKIYTEYSDQDRCAYTLYRYYGFRRNEGLHQGISRVLDSGSELIMQIRGDSTFRTKTPAANRNGRSLEKIQNEAADAFKVRIHQGTGLGSPYLTLKNDHEKIVSNISNAIKSVTDQGHIHIFRHNYGDSLFRDLLNFAIWGVRKKNLVAPRCSFLTTPQGIRRHTLYAAARLLGHSSPKMLLTTYSHCGFEVLDSVYRQFTPTEAPLPKQQPNALASKVDQNSPPSEEKPSQSSNGLSKDAEPPKQRAIDLITRRFAMLDGVIPLSESLPFLEFSEFLKMLPPTHRPSLGEVAGTKYLKPSRVFLNELKDTLILRNSTLEVLSELSRLAIKSLETILAYETRNVREQRKTYIQNFFDKNLTLQPIGNFNKDKLFAVRERSFHLDLSLFLSIINLSQTKVTNFCFKTNAPTSHHVTKALLKLGFGELDLTKHDHRKSLEFNLEHGLYWLFTTRPTSPPVDQSETNPSKSATTKEDKKKSRGRPKGSRKVSECKIDRAFDNSKMYLYGLTLQILMLTNYET